MNIQYMQRVWCTLLFVIGCFSARAGVSNTKLFHVERPTLPKIPNFQENNLERLSHQDMQTIRAYLEEFEQRYGTRFLQEKCNYDFLSFVQNDADSLSLEQEYALHFLKTMLEELVSKRYSQEEFQHYMNWSLNLSSALFSKNYEYAQTELNDLFYEVKEASIESMIPRSLEESRRHKAFAIRNEQGEVSALVKLVKEPKNAWAPVAPVMEQKGSAGLYEKVGYDFDVILGLKMTPATLRGKIELGKGHLEDVVIQKFVSDTVVLSDLLYQSNGASLLLSLPKAPAQMMALSGMIKGSLGGHFGNYLFHLKDGMIDTIYDIDLDELLPPCNRLKRGMLLYPFKEDRGQMNRIDVSRLDADLQDTAYRSAPLCRMCILGLPQNGRPFERACLKMIAHPLLGRFLDEYHKSLEEKQEIRKECLEAQKERFFTIQKICQEQLQLTDITLTPRDLYFYLFGGRHLYETALKKGYPSLVIFNQVIGDPLQHSMIDFSRPEKMLFYNLLQDTYRVNQKVVRNRVLLNNLQMLEAQESRSWILSSF